MIWYDMNLIFDRVRLRSNLNTYHRSHKPRNWDLCTRRMRMTWNSTKPCPLLKPLTFSLQLHLAIPKIHHSFRNTSCSDLLWHAGELLQKKNSWTIAWNQWQAQALSILLDSPHQKIYRSLREQFQFGVAWGRVWYDSMIILMMTNDKHDSSWV